MIKRKLSENNLREDYKKALPFGKGWDGLFFSLLISLFSFQSLYAQTPPYYHYTSADGLASSTVFDILQDKGGFIWFGTQSGLSKFDGKNFTNYRIQDGLNSNMITHLVEGDHGEKYLAAYEKGINILKNNKISNFRNRIKGKQFTTSYLLRYNKKIYTYTSFGEIYIMNENSLNQATDKILNSSPNYLYRLAVLSDGKLVALTSRGLFNISKNNFIKMRIKDLPDTTVLCLAERKDHSYFVGSSGAMYHIKDNHVIKKLSIPGYSEKSFYMAFCDSKDNIWFSVLGKGFYLIPSNSDKIIEMGSRFELENTQVNKFYEDREGNIWICTFGKGAYCLNNLYLTNFTEKEGLNNNNIICIEKDKFGRLLIGTINGIGILENGKVEKLKDNSGKILGGYIHSIKIFNDTAYVCWAAERPEIKSCFFKGLHFRFISAPSFLKTKNGGYIVGNIGNDIRIPVNFNSNRVEYHSIYVFGDSIFQNRINNISEDSKGSIWIATSNGACMFSGFKGYSDSKNFKKTFFPKSPVLSSRINSIFYDDKSKEVWFTGNKGIAKYILTDNSVESFTSFSGYDLAGATAIVSDNKNRIWVATMNGLFIIQKKSVTYLNNRTGLPSDEVFTLYFDSLLNKLYIGTSNGLSVLDINLYENYRLHIPQIIVSKIKAGDSIYTDYNNLIFQPDQNNISIDFIALDYSSPGSVKYKYNLNGIWIETNHNFLDLISLKSGTYRLQIIAKSQNTDWSKPYFLTFQVQPRFVDTFWFFLLILVGIIMFLAIMLLWRLKLYRTKNRDKLELTERINELKHQALSAMMNPHFIFNSLNSVQYLINSQRNEEANDYIAMMAKLIRKNLDTVGSGFILLSEEINRLKLYLDLEKLRFQERFSYEIISGSDLDIDSVLIPNMIIQPFAENTLWHGIINSGIKGMITISFSFEDVEIDSKISKSLIIKITDNGIGINAAKKNKKEDHISKGIQIIEERLRLLSAKMELPKPIILDDLSCRNDNLHGTEVIISLPPHLYKMINS